MPLSRGAGCFARQDWLRVNPSPALLWPSLIGALLGRSVIAALQGGGREVQALTSAAAGEVVLSRPLLFTPHCCGSRSGATAPIPEPSRACRAAGCPNSNRAPVAPATTGKTSFRPSTATS